MGDIYITTKAENPSTTWLGTTWEKIEGRFLLGTSSSQASKLTGGSMNKNISQANLPNVKLAVDSFSLSRGNMNITGSYLLTPGHGVVYDDGATGAFYAGVHQGNRPNTMGGPGKTLMFDASRSWKGTTNSVSPQTSALGSGQALDITPSYYTTHIWLRTS